AYVQNLPPLPQRFLRLFHRSIPSAARSLSHSVFGVASPALPLPASSPVLACSVFLIAGSPSSRLPAQCYIAREHHTTEGSISPWLAPQACNTCGWAASLRNVTLKVEKRMSIVQNDNQETHIYDYHITYSFSFKVPVLYFRGQRYDGRPLRHNEIEIDLPPHSLSILKESKWTYITQEDHPFLRRPWFVLHPCGTRDWMKLLLPNTQAMDGHVVQQYLASWLSVVGQAVGLRVPLEMQNKSSISSFH
ncbi:hypothetical protein Taro_016686, partial [Colocasia esculenta]|nr:hypothetical protein [Colocasia esculenta]